MAEKAVTVARVPGMAVVREEVLEAKSRMDFR